ncbi:WD40/YVTN/BNR-like repeat-containing protein [Allorhizocola rhizosphaerae]|uniref:WD40/YVTN/BNR-like repeat-containing protein n=1 Tax=Allorhizocola rhizosphaerae TaxID=1872709 RepID=UPI000E3E03F4|nr:sialidase family protein [Allorhizocola rhizosphaerae]
MNRWVRSRRLRIRLVGVLAGAAVVTLVASLLSLAGSPVAPHNAVAPEVENPAEPYEWMWLQRANADGSIPPTAYRDALAQVERIEAETDAVGPQLSGARWQLLGPSNIGGRLIDLVLDPKTPGIVYVAAGTGGVWKSTDGGVTMSSVWPDRLPQSLGALAIAPDGTLYAGTGEPDHGGGGSYYGTGVYRSTDGGAHWHSLGLSDTGAIGRIRIDPADPRRIFVAAQGRLFDTGGERGVYLSENGGKSWRKVLDGLNSSTGAIDLAINPANPDIVLAAMWDKLRFPDGREYGGPGSGVYRSTDGGQTWARIGAPLPAPETEPGRIGVAFAQSDPNRAYAITNDRIGNLTGFFVSNDAGATWIRPMTGEPALDSGDGGFAWWFARLWVDPNDADHLFSAGVPMMESRNGGANWVASPGGRFHVDQHAMAWDPHHPGRVYIGNDGGLYWSDQNGDVTGTWTAASYQPYMQFYAMDVSVQDVTRVSGGTQDNNSLRSWGGTDWNAYRGGDGMFNRINPVDHNNVFACAQNGACVRSDDGGNTITNIRPRFAGTRFNWASPLEIAAGDPSTVYFGSNILNRSDDRGVTWRAVSPDLTGGPSPRGTFGTITTIGIAPSDKETVYVGTDDGRLWVTRDGGGAWTQLTDPGLPQRWVTRVTVDPDDANTAWVTYSGFKWESETQPHVLMTTDGGAHWTDISGNLPQAPVNDVIRHPKHRKWLYIGTDMGVFFTPNLGRTWLKVGKSFPAVPVTDIHYHAPTGTLFAATFGRSILKTTVG